MQLPSAFRVRPMRALSCGEITCQFLFDFRVNVYSLRFRCHVKMFSIRTPRNHIFSLLAPTLTYDLDMPVLKVRVLSAATYALVWLLAGLSASALISTVHVYWLVQSRRALYYECIFFFIVAYFTHEAVFLSSKSSGVINIFPLRIVVHEGQSYPVTVSFDQT